MYKKTYQKFRKWQVMIWPLGPHPTTYITCLHVNVKGGCVPNICREQRPSIKNDCSAYSALGGPPGGKYFQRQNDSGLVTNGENL